MLRRAEIDITTVSISRNLQVEGASWNNCYSRLYMGGTIDRRCRLVNFTRRNAGNKTLGRMQTVGFFIATPSRCQQEHRCHLCRSVGSGQAGLLNGYKATCYPGFEQFLTGATVTGDNVTVDRNITTGKGPGAAISFATAIITQIAGKKKPVRSRAACYCKSSKPYR